MLGTDTESLPIRHLLSYTEAIMRVYNRYGRRDNKYKARIKILVRALTAEGFKTQVDEEWAAIDHGQTAVPASELRRLSAFFAPPAFAKFDDADTLLGKLRLENPDFNRWMKHNVSPHRVRGYAAVTLSTKTVGTPPGDVSAEQMDAVAAWASAFGFEEIRISHEQNFVLPHIPQHQLYDLWQQAQSIGLGHFNAGLISDMICCPGGDYCSLANAKSCQLPKPFSVGCRLRFST